MRYSRTMTPPPRKKKRYANLIIVMIILGIAAYLVSAGAAGSWLADNIINPIFNNGIANAAPATATAAVTASGSAKTLPPSPLVSPTDTGTDNTPAASGTRAEEEVTAQEITLYTLQAGAFSDKANADTTANTIKAQGGAGFVDYDSSLYKVLIAGYTDESDANDVIASLKTQGVDATVFQLKSGTLKFKIDAEQDQIDAVKECFCEVPDAVNTLQQIIFNSDKGQNVDGDIASLKDKVSGVANDFNGEISSDETAVKSLKDYMDKFCAAINGLPSSSSSASAAFSSGLKYALIQIVTDYSSFLTSLKG